MYRFWIILGIVLVIWFLYWVLRHIHYVSVKEATAVAFNYCGKFTYMAMEWKNHHFDQNRLIATGEGPKFYGECWCIWRFQFLSGWVFFLYPLVKPARYNDTNEPDAFGDGYYIHLNDITPEPTVSAAETTEVDGASVPLDIEFVSTMRVVDPYKWLYIAPKNANTQVTKRMDSVLRAWVKSSDEKHAQSVKGNGEALWKELIQIPDATHPNALNCGPTIDKMKSDWGLEVMRESIIVQDVGYDSEYQQAMQAKSLADLTADGEVQATSGRVIKTVAESVGLSVEQLKKKLARNPKLRGMPASERGYKEAFAFAEDIVKRDRASLGGVDELRIGNPDGTPINGELGGAAAFATLFGRGGGNKGCRVNNDRGRNEGQNQKGASDSSGEYRPTTKDYEREAQKFFDQNGVWPVWDPKHRHPDENESQI